MYKYVLFFSCGYVKVIAMYFCLLLLMHFPSLFSLYADALHVVIIDTCTSFTDGHLSPHSLVPARREPANEAPLSHTASKEISSPGRDLSKQSDNGLHGDPWWSEQCKCNKTRAKHA